MNIRFFEGWWQASEVKEKLIVFFDRECLLCQTALKWLNRLDSNDRLLFAPLGGETAQGYEINPGDDSMAAVESGEVWRASEAARRAFYRAGGIGHLIAGLLTVIPLGLRDWGYRWIARNRKKFHGSGTCEIPEEGMREKMQP